MAINFTDSPSNGATQTISGRTYTYNSAKNKWDTTATEVTGPTATTYATVNDLPGTATAGDQAFVSGTNRLYIWNGSGWYNIALINNTPTWTTQPASSYALAIDGTATVVSIVASDPEGLPITYSITSDTSGNVATVVQGTGLNTNSWTITPSTSNADAGTFSLTFRASDGINLATAVSSFTLVFSVQNQRYTTALITSVGANNAVNNSFDDKSTSNHTITAAGDAHQTTFSPYRHGGYSNYYYDTINGYYSATLTNALGSGSWTVEGWFYKTGGNNDFHTAWHVGTVNQSDSMSIAVNNTSIQFRSNGTTTSTINISNTVNRWIHLAWVFDGSTLEVFENGTSIGTVSRSLNIAQKVVSVGYYNTAFSNEGYITDFRISDTQRYTTDFTAPDERLTADTDTVFLLQDGPYAKDLSSSNLTVTKNGTVNLEPFAPYDAQEYAVAGHGGSISLDGTGDSISAASSADLGFGTGDFSIEWWTYFDAISNYPYQIDMRSADNDTGLALFTRTNLANELGVYVSASVIAGGTNSFKPGIWTHYAICKTGGYLKGYMNGVEDFSITCTRDYGSSKAIRIGSVYGNGNYHVNGNIADVRIVKGTATRTGNFTPPTAPLTAITNTKLLVQSTDGAVIDKSQTSSVLVLDGDTKCSSTQTKYRSTAIYTDGTGDRVRFGINNKKLVCDWGVGGEPFTVEWWMYDTQPYTAQHSFGPQTGGGAGAWNSSTGHQWITYWHSNVLNIYYYGTNGSYNGNTCTAAQLGIVQNQWQHVAHTYDGTTWRLYVDGVHGFNWALPNQPASVSGTYAALGSFAEAAYYTAAYYDDVRITKGLARYTGTSSFTPPTAALQG